MIEWTDVRDAIPTMDEPLRQQEILLWFEKGFSISVFNNHAVEMIEEGGVTHWARVEKPGVSNG